MTLAEMTLEAAKVRPTFPRLDAGVLMTPAGFRFGMTWEKYLKDEIGDIYWHDLSAGLSVRLYDLACPFMPPDRWFIVAAGGLVFVYFDRAAAEGWFVKMTTPAGRSEFVAGLVIDGKEIALKGAKRAAVMAATNTSDTRVASDHWNDLRGEATD